MREFEEHMRARAGKIRLSSVEKRELRERLLAYMAYHPLPESITLANIRPVAPSPSVFNMIRTGWQARSLIGVAAFLLIAGIPAVAERAVPGDVLYPVKVRVNEEVLATLSMGPYEKMEWETRRVERRVAEARLLAKEGRLTEEVEAQISETVKEHTANAEKELALLRESDAEEAAVAQVVLESALDVQSAMLKTEGASSTGDIGSLATAVADAQATLALMPTEGGISTASYERFLYRTRESLAHSRESLLSIETSLTSEEQGEIDRRLEDIAKRVEEAERLANNGAMRDAIRMLRDALRDSQKLSAFMTDIEVRSSVALETLVPREMTVEERRLTLRALRDELVLRAAAVQVRTTFSSDSALGVELEQGLATIATYIATMEASLGEGAELEAGEGVSDEARTLMADLETKSRDLVPPVQGSEASASATGTSAGGV